jgi:hypothetical protein
MFATTVLAGFVSAALAADPVAAVQEKYPAHRTSITTASGTVVCYTLPADAPPELRRAYKALEVAEREVLVSEAIQTLEREYVANERFLEALRTNYAAFYLRSPSTFSPRFYSLMPVTQPESSMKWAFTQNLNRSWAADRSLIALDRLALAHFQLQQVLDGIAHPDRPKPPPLPALRPAPAPAPPPAANVVRLGPGAMSRPQARQAEQAAAKDEAAAEARERAAREKELAAEAAYRASLPDDRDAARKAWLAAREEWEDARRAWDAARGRWQTARDRLDAAPVVHAPRAPQVRRTR